ncbi:MAG: dTMP kinase [Syntrophales bacterium]|nr:dTMP kinase [Syntrophales bacterium]
MGRFITFEGIEGGGKTTQIKMAGEYLEQRHIPFLTISEPGGTSLGEKIRKILLSRGDHAVCAEAEVLLFSAARVQHVRDVILPAMKEGKIVLCDRFCDSTLVYQGFGRGVDHDFIRGINNFTCAGLKPDMTILFDLPVEIGLSRAMKRMISHGNAAEDRFEGEALDFHRRVREGYLLLAGQEPWRFRILDSAKDIVSINREVCSCLRRFVRGSIEC